MRKVISIVAVLIVLINSVHAEYFSIPIKDNNTLEGSRYSYNTTDYQSQFEAIEKEAYGRLHFFDFAKGTPSQATIDAIADTISSELAEKVAAGGPSLAGVWWAAFNACLMTDTPQTMWTERQNKPPLYGSNCPFIHVAGGTSAGVRRSLGDEQWNKLYTLMEYIHCDEQIMARKWIHQNSLREGISYSSGCLVALGMASEPYVYQNFTKYYKQIFTDSETNNIKDPWCFSTEIGLYEIQKNGDGWNPCFNPTPEQCDENMKLAESHIQEEDRKIIKAMHSSANDKELTQMRLNFMTMMDGETLLKGYVSGKCKINIENPSKIREYLKKTNWTLDDIKSIYTIAGAEEVEKYNSFDDLKKKIYIIMRTVRMGSSDSAGEAKAWSVGQINDALHADYTNEDYIATLRQAAFFHKTDCENNGTAAQAGCQTMDEYYSKFKDKNILHLINAGGTDEEIKAELNKGTNCKAGAHIMTWILKHMEDNISMIPEGTGHAGTIGSGYVYDESWQHLVTHFENGPLITKVDDNWNSYVS